MQVELDAASPEVARPTRRKRCLLAQVPADPRGQLGRGEGLDDHVHRAVLECLDPEGDVSGGGEHDHGRGGITLPQNVEDVEPTTTRHDEVEQDKVHLTGVELVQRCLTVSGLIDSVALGRERSVQKCADPGFIVHHEQGGHGCSPRRFRRARDWPRMAARQRAENQRPCRRRRNPCPGSECEPRRPPPTSSLASSLARHHAPKSAGWATETRLLTRCSCSAIAGVIHPSTTPSGSLRRPDFPGAYRNGAGFPAPTRTTSGYPWDQSTTVLGSFPHSPESSTASIVWSSSSLICQPSVIGSSS